MIALALFGNAALLLLAAAPALRRVRLFDRSPRLGILAWQVLTTSALLSVVLGGLALLVPSVPVSSSLAEFLEACAMMLRYRYATPAGAFLGSLGIAFALVVCLRTAYHLVLATTQARRLRRAHRETAILAGHPRSGGVTLLEHAVPAVYCLPGRTRHIVLTTGALEALEPQQLEAVLAHEREHLRARHHLVLMAAGAVATAFPHIRAFRTAHTEISRLVELAADDAAVRRTGRFTLAEALLALADSQRPAAALAAGGSTAGDRVRRLIDAQGPRRLVSVLIGGALAVSVLVLPVMLATGPALSAIGAEYCPIGPVTWQAQLAALLG